MASRSREGPHTRTTGSLPGSTRRPPADSARAGGGPGGRRPGTPPVGRRPRPPAPHAGPGAPGEAIYVPQNVPIIRTLHVKINIKLDNCIVAPVPGPIGGGSPPVRCGAVRCDAGPLGPSPSTSPPRESKALQGVNLATSPGCPPGSRDPGPLPAAAGDADRRPARIEGRRAPIVGGIECRRSPRGDEAEPRAPAQVVGIRASIDLP
jgi:hypothetical protein